MQESKKNLSFHKLRHFGTARSVKVSLIILGLAFLVLIGFFITKQLIAPQTPLDKAIVLIHAGKVVLALPILEQISQQHPDNPAVCPWLAQCYLSTDRLAEGRIALDTALRMGLPTKDVLSAVLLYTSYYQEKGDFEEAEKLLQLAEHSCPMSTLGETKAKLYVDWAEKDLAQEDLKRAVNHLEKAGELNQFVSEPLKSYIPHRLSEGYRSLAALAGKQENSDDQVIALLAKSLKASDEPATRMILAGMYVKKANIAKAIENYRSVAELDQNNLEARHRLIDLLLSTKDFEGAQEALMELTEKEKSVENYQQLVDANLSLKNYAGAVHALEDACDLRLKPELLKQLLTVLNEWNILLTKEKKLQEAASVKGHADRVAEQLSNLEQEDKEKAEKLAANAALKAGDFGNGGPPINLIFSRTWLASGSVTPEGEIKIKNIVGRPVSDLTLTAVFYDNTARRTNGSVTVPVATMGSLPFAANDSRTLYFSCPNIVNTDHQLAVRIFWRGRFLREFPVAK